MREFYVTKIKDQVILVEVLDVYNHPIAPKALVMRAGNKPSQAHWVPLDSVKSIDNRQLIELVSNNYTVIPA